MSVECFIIHSVDGENTCWFSHFFESIVKKDDNNKQKVNKLIYRVYRDYKIQTSTVEYHNEISYEGYIKDQNWFIVYKQVQEYVLQSIFTISFCFTMACKLDSNRVLASYTMGQLVYQILSAMSTSMTHFDPKEVLYRTSLTQTSFYCYQKIFIPYYTKPFHMVHLYCAVTCHN
jgi:hypothetical protein